MDKRQARIFRAEMQARWGLNLDVAGKVTLGIDRVCREFCTNNRTVFKSRRGIEFLLDVVRLYDAWVRDADPGETLDDKIEYAVRVAGGTKAGHWCDPDHEQRAAAVAFIIDSKMKEEVHE